MLQVHTSGFAGCFSHIILVSTYYYKLNYALCHWEKYPVCHFNSSGKLMSLRKGITFIASSYATVVSCLKGLFSSRMFYLFIMPPRTIVILYAYIDTILLFSLVLDYDNVQVLVKCWSSFKHNYFQQVEWCKNCAGMQSFFQKVLY